MNNQLKIKIRTLLTDPTFLILLLSIMLGLVLLVGVHFKIPDFYTDKALADSIAQEASRGSILEATKHLINPKYHIYNNIFQVFGWSIAILSFCLIFRIKKFNDFKNLTVLNNKKFVYFWINLSYIAFVFLYTNGYMIDIEKYVYPHYADSMGIPFFTCIAMNVFIGIIYYPLANLLAFITYNTSIKRLIYSVLWITLFLYWSLIAFGAYFWKFSYQQILLDFYFLVWFILTIYSLGFLKNKATAKNILK